MTHANIPIKSGGLTSQDQHKQLASPGPASAARTHTQPYSPLQGKVTAHTLGALSPPAWSLSLHPANSLNAGLPGSLAAHGALSCAHHQEEDVTKSSGIVNSAEGAAAAIPDPQTGRAGRQQEAEPFKRPSSSPLKRPGAQVNRCRPGQVPAWFGFTKGKANCSVWAPAPHSAFPAQSRMLLWQTPRRAQPASLTPRRC